MRTAPKLTNSNRFIIGKNKLNLNNSANAAGQDCADEGREQTYWDDVSQFFYFGG